MGTSLQAQEVVADTAKLRERAMQFSMGGKNIPEPKPFNMALVPGNEVRILPQDGMPCIVPYTGDIALMPNAFPAKNEETPVAGQIPNAWQPKTQKLKPPAAK